MKATPILLTLATKNSSTFPNIISFIPLSKKVQQFQSGKYDIEAREPLYTFLYQLPGLDEKELYALSLEREARDVTLRELELKDKRE